MYFVKQNKHPTEVISFELYLIELFSLIKFASSNADLGIGVNNYALSSQKIKSILNLTLKTATNRTMIL
jgi:hypothetical protein